MKKILILVSAVALSSCVSYDNYYKLDAEYLARRQLETRRFETKDEDAMLIASAQVLQDLGFTISESETKLGLITASKTREMGSTAGKIAIVTLAAFGGGRAVYDTEQKIHVTLVSSKSRGAKGFNVRVEFARMIWNNQGETRIERIRDRDIYADFFDRLGQSLFLTANDI